MSVRSVPQLDKTQTLDKVLHFAHNTLLLRDLGSIPCLVIVDLKPQKLLNGF
jgi:hypothetical protein